jgi:hypothetical protein
VNETVAVALITAGAALAASLLTAWFTSRSSVRQLEYQLQLAREERNERRAGAHREVRRDAYVRFLNEALATAAQIRQTRPDFVEISDEEFTERYNSARETLLSLSKIHGVMVVAGPVDVSDAATDVRSALEKELNLVREARADRDLQDALDKAQKDRTRALGALAGKARDALTS